MSKSFKDESRKAWQRSDDKQVTEEQMIIGCLQRIADATEVMAKNYVQMENELKKYKLWYQEERTEKERLQRSIVAHKANYTRLKNKQKGFYKLLNSRSEIFYCDCKNDTFERPNDFTFRCTVCQKDYEPFEKQ